MRIDNRLLKYSYQLTPLSQPLFFYSFSQNQLYNVVSNVEDYHQFIPFCVHSHVYTNKPVGNGVNVMEAELGVGFKLFEEKYMSKVTCKKPSLVQVWNEID